MESKSFFSWLKWGFIDWNTVLTQVRQANRYKFFQLVMFFPYGLMTGPYLNICNTYSEANHLPIVECDGWYKFS